MRSVEINKIFWQQLNSKIPASFHSSYTFSEPCGPLCWDNRPVSRTQEDSDWNVAAWFLAKKKKGSEYKFHARQFVKSGIAMRMLSAPILICFLSANTGRSLKSILTWAPVYTHVSVSIRPSSPTPFWSRFHPPRLARMCVEQFTPTRSAAANSVYFHCLFLFRALLKTAERCLEIRGSVISRVSRAPRIPRQRIPALSFNEESYAGGDLAPNWGLEIRTAVWTCSTLPRPLSRTRDSVLPDDFVLWLTRITSRSMGASVFCWTFTFLYDNISGQLVNVLRLV